MSYPNERPVAQFRGVRVLIVEPSWHVAKAIKSLLEDFGVTVPALAGTVEDAEQLMEKHVFDLAIVDIDPKDHKDELMKRLNNYGVRVIALSGYSLAAIPNTVSILPKPVGRRELLALLTKLCSRSRRHL